MRTFLIVFCLSLFSLPSFAATPTPEQMAQFKSLPPAQQAALAESQGFSLPGSTGSNQESPEPVVDTVQKFKRERIDPSKKEVLPDQADKTKAFEESDLFGHNRYLKEPARQKKNLHVFGASLFAGSPTTFAPVNDIPIPTDYILGPGDQLKIQLFGNKNANYQLVIDRNGSVSLPEIGPISLAGLTFSDAVSVLNKEIDKLGIGVSASVTLGELRSFRVFVMGESRNPGSYLVSGMATITHALYVSGGISEIGSFRDIQLKRQGKLIETIDLYDLMISGNSKQDVRLQPGDTVFIPVRNRSVSISGEVKRPAIYELKSEKKVADLIALAGGFTNEAMKQKVKLTRLNKDGFSVISDLNLTKKQDLSTSLQDGDAIKVLQGNQTYDKYVSLTGQIYQDGLFAWYPKMTVLDLLPNIKVFKRQADLNYALVLRQAASGEPMQVKTFSWKAIASGEQQDLALLSNDQVIVLPRRLVDVDDSSRSTDQKVGSPQRPADGQRRFQLDDQESASSQQQVDDRRSQLDDVIKILEQQATRDNPLPVVSVAGMVKFPGKYPINDRTRLSDIVLAAGGLTEKALNTQAELFRYQIVDGEKRVVKREVFNPKQVLYGNKEDDFLLQPYDEVSFKQIAQWNETFVKVTVKGEVQFPGEYRINPGETMQELLTRVGGFTEWAEPKNIVFTRESLKKREALEMQQMADDLEKNLLMALKADAGLIKGDSASIQALGQSLISRLKETPAIGRLVVTLDRNKPVGYSSTLNMELRDGDVLYVPKRSYEVLVTGEVSRAASLIYQPNMSVSEYLEKSGGATKRADTDSIYVVHGDGSVEKVENGWFDSSLSTTVMPGDSIVVPLDIERMNPLVSWISISSILADFAVTAATLNTIGLFN